MGAVFFSLEDEFLSILTSSLTIPVLLETGTFEGDTVAVAQKYFKEIYSVELSEEYYQSVVKRFNKNEHVHLYQGDSVTVMRDLQETLKDQAVLYFLDAHWCVAENTAGKLSQCPLLGEIASIGQLNDDSIIVIDDARLFLTIPPAPHEVSDWPTFSQVLKQLQAISSKHDIMVVNDRIVYFSEKHRANVEAYAKQHGIDWLHILSTGREQADLYKQLVEKEAVIQELLNKQKSKTSSFKKWLQS